VAAYGDDLEVVQVLIAQRADVNKQSSKIFDNFLAPLHFATYKGHLEVVKKLLDSNANVDIQDVNQGTPLHWAVSGKHLNVVEKLLNSKANINAQDRIGQTPLHVAFALGARDIQKALKNEGARMDIKDHQGRNPEALKVMGRFSIIERKLTSTPYEIGELKEKK